MPSRRRDLAANVRYLRALARRFRVTFILAVLMAIGGPWAFHTLYRAPDGARISWGEAVHHVYFLMFGQPSLAYVDDLRIELLNLLIPPLGIAVVVDGLVRFAYLFFAKQQNDKEWIAVLTQGFRDHVIVCGAGKIGFRVVNQLLELGHDVVVIEKREDGPFIGALRDKKVPVLVEDIRGGRALDRVNVQQAAAIVCATDDDLANLNVALDARKHNAEIRVVIRLFDDDLVAKVPTAFGAEALSTSALAAPAMALTALDPRILHSFHVGAHLMVVSNFRANAVLSAMTCGDVRDHHGGLTLELRRVDGSSLLHPTGSTKIGAGDTLTLQMAYADYRKFRAFIGEANPPVTLRRANEDEAA